MKRLTAILLVLVMMASFAGVASAEVSSANALVYYGLYTVTEEYAQTLYNRLLYWYELESPTEADLWMAAGAAWAYFYVFTLNALEFCMASNTSLDVVEGAVEGTRLAEDYISVYVVDSYRSGEITIKEAIGKLVDLVAPYVV